MSATSPRRDRLFALGLPAVVLLAALLTMAGVGLLGTLLAQEQLGEARAAKAAAVAEAVQHDLQRAIGHGIPLDRMEGVAAYLQGIAGRNPDLGFLAVTGADGRRLHAALPEGSRLDAARLDALAAGLRGLPPPASREAAVQPIARDDLLVVRLPLRAASTPGATASPVGYALVGVRPGEVRGQIAGELAVVGMGGAAILLLLAEIAGAMAQASVHAPLDRLARVMRAAVAGDFATLVGRRPRDQLGRALFAFNAAVFRLHDRRQRFAAHAEEVRAAVFDPEVARAVEAARRDALAALGPGLETAPRRVVDARAVDARAFAALAAAAATLLILAGGGGPLVALPVLLGLVLAGRIGAAWRRLAALAVAVALALAALPLLGGGELAGLERLGLGARVGLGPLFGGLVGGLCGGLAAGLSLAYARRQAGEGVPLILRALAAGVAAALLWAAALGWDAVALAGSALVPALLAVPMARPFVVPRR